MNLANFHGSAQKYENLHFDGLLFSKAYKFQMNNYRKVMHHDSKKLCKN